ncbi:Alpha/Beta hydrolase protein [Cercophora newfieldiana]|uniref:Alpha/Beta hydrolase protein n=1 Tax=Cercophora newfieldiana TaxID=92897 RepID=A0AA39XVB6_9PEZI|nr:Alpha/Beta hydrolase protein [Cercophora newfieldiana]
MNTATVSLAVTPTVISTLVSHYFNPKPRKQKPTAHISYDEGLHLIRSFLEHASRHTVEELQAFTSQWVPHPQWVKVDEVDIPLPDLARAASLLADQLGPSGIRRVGGSQWWQWRQPESPLKAEWIEMKSDYQQRKRDIDPGNRVMMYVHGGAYFFGSVDEHRYQIQRHARKLKARAIAPRYRLAPQFPFPCGLQDCLATYLYLLSQQEPSTIILAGDSAGGGMIVSLLVVLRDRGIPLPAGAVLISPWVDLTHSFPSMGEECPLDYIPASGFHHRPSMAWPPPSEAELEELKRQAVLQKKEIVREKGAGGESGDAPTMRDVEEATTRLKLVVDGEEVEIREQIQLYTTNELLAHPLVSPVMQPTLGGLCPLLIIVGGGEMLRDEQIYLAHKCANPEGYLPAEALMDEQARKQVKKYPPTDVQLQVWDELCHVAPTLSFTSPAKYMYRSVAQFSAWCLARAQKCQIDIPNDDRISVISKSSSDEDKKPQVPTEKPRPETKTTPSRSTTEQSIGKAGDPLPPFIDHMIRQRVTFHGAVYPLPPPQDLPACTVPRDHVGVIKVGPVRKWLAHKDRWANRYRAAHKRIREQRLRGLTIGYEVFGEGEVPPPTALAGRRKLGGEEFEIRKKVKGWGLALWGIWGSKHDEMTVERGRLGDGREREVQGTGEGEGARTWSDLQMQEGVKGSGKFGRLVAGRGLPILGKKKWGNGDGDGKVVKVEGVVEVEGGDEDEKEGEKDDGAKPAMETGHRDNVGGDEDLLWPGRAMGESGSTGKRKFIEGLATPFSMRKEADTASMITLQPSRPTTPGPNRLSFMTPEGTEGEKGESFEDGKGPKIEETEEDGALSPGTAATTPFLTPMVTPGLVTPGARPGLETFVTAQEVPRASS